MRWVLILLFVYFSPALVADDDYKRELDSYAEHWINLGIMEAAEKEYFFKYWQSIDFDWSTMIYRVSLMEPDCPEFYDKYRMPKLNIGDQYRVSCRFVEYLEMEIMFSGPTQQLLLWPLLKEQRWRRDLWWEICSVDEGRSNEGTRIHLQNIRKMVGRDNYEKCIWPNALIDQGYNIDWIIK